MNHGENWTIFLLYKNKRQVLSIKFCHVIVCPMFLIKCTCACFPGFHLDSHLMFLECLFGVEHEGVGKQIALSKLCHVTVIKI